MNRSQALELANQAYDLLTRIENEFEHCLKKIDGGDGYQFAKDAVEATGELAGLLEEDE